MRLFIKIFILIIGIFQLSLSHGQVIKNDTVINKGNIHTDTIQIDPKIIRCGTNPDQIIAKDYIIIDSSTYEVISRYSNGSINKVGQFDLNCVGKKQVKNGHFLKYSKKGKLKYDKFFYYGHRENRRILFLKQGWFESSKFFMGIPIKVGVIRDPCW